MKDELYMRRALELAKLGSVKVAPNPMVGAVIVYQDKIIGEGYHQIFGGPHAEVNAVNSVKNQSILKEATIYVTLEPCSHYGKTPPCADLLVQHGFKRVVIGSIDTYSEVSGTGIKRIQNAGIDVRIDILENECRELNKRFFTYHEKKRPFIILKWAESADGFTDKERINDITGVNWITQDETQTLVHKWRSEEQAILVGKNTILNDNPSLTVRNIKGNNPIRVILDSNLSISNSAKIFDNSAKTLILNKVKSSEVGNIEYVQLQEMTPEKILEVLYNKGILSVFIEGGSRVLQSFLDENLWDEAFILKGLPIFKSGIKAPVISQQPLKFAKFGEDQLFSYKNL